MGSQNIAGVLVMATFLGFGGKFADVTQWANVQSTAQNEKVGVIYDQGKRVEGRLRLATADAITVASELGEVKIEKSAVVRVYKVSGMSRTRRALIGAAAGAVVGVVVDQTLGTRLRNEGSDTGGAVTAGAIAGGAGLGAALGAAYGDYQTIYRKMK